MEKVEPFRKLLKNARLVRGDQIHLDGVSPVHLDIKLKRSVGAIRVELNIPAEWEWTNVSVVVISENSRASDDLRKALNPDRSQQRVTISSLPNGNDLVFAVSGATMVEFQRHPE